MWAETLALLQWVQTGVGSQPDILAPENCFCKSSISYAMRRDFFPPRKRSFPGKSSKESKKKVKGMLSKRTHISEGHTEWLYWEAMGSCMHSHCCALQCSQEGHCHGAMLYF